MRSLYPHISLLLSILFANFGFCDDRENLAAPQFSQSQPIYFEIGLRIRSTGNSSGISATVPVPVDWPEQTITIVKKKKTDHLKPLKFKDRKDNVRQLVLSANQLGPNEVAEGTVIVRADKKFVLPPNDPGKLNFAKKVPSKIRQYLRPSPYIESNDKRIRELAQSLEISSTANAWEQVESIYKWVRDKVEYKFDRQIHSCLDSLDSGVGDCEEMSSIFIAICRARGIPARAVWIPGHTYPEFYLVDEHGDGHWFPCQAAGSYQFGAMAETRPILQKGDRFRIPGSRKTLRYVQPTLVAKHSSGGLSIEFITKQITDESQLEQLRQEKQ